MADGISFTVRGTPMPKGSTTKMPGGAYVPAGSTTSRAKMGQWREDVRHEAQRSMGERPPFMGAIRLFVEFNLMPPRTTIRKYQWGWLPHTRKPDVDKLLRAVCDALTGVVWRDDAQVCVVAMNKHYAWDGITGCIVTVNEIDDEDAQRLATARNALLGLVR